MTLKKSVAAALLNGNGVKLTDCQAENNDRPSNFMIFLEDDGNEANRRLELQKRAENR